MEGAECYFKLNDTEGFVNRTDISDETISFAIDNAKHLDCLWEIEVQTNWKVIFY